MVSCYGLAFSGGFTNSVLAMDWNSYLRAEGGPIEYPNGTVPESAYGNPPNPLPRNVVQPTIGKLIGFMAVIYFIGKIFTLTMKSQLIIVALKLAMTLHLMSSKIPTSAKEFSDSKVLTATFHSSA